MVSVHGTGCFFYFLSDGFQDKNKLGKYKGIPCDKGGANEEIIK